MYTPVSEISIYTCERKSAWELCDAAESGRIGTKRHGTLLAKPKPMRSLFSLSITSDAMSWFWPSCAAGAAITRASGVETCLLVAFDEGTDWLTCMFEQLASVQPASASRILPIIVLIVR